MIRMYIINKETRDDIAGPMYRLEVEIRSKRRETDVRFVRQPAMVFVTAEVYEKMVPGNEYELNLGAEIVKEEPPPPPKEESVEETPPEEPTENLN